MKKTQVILLILYVGLILLFWSPFVTWHFVDHSAVSPYDTHPVRGLLMVPFMPLLFLSVLVSTNISHLGQTILAPLYLAVLFWPLLVVVCKPDLLRKTVTKVVVGGYTVMFLAAMAYSTFVMTLLRNSRP